MPWTATVGLLLGEARGPSNNVWCSGMWTCGHQCTGAAVL